MEFEATAWEVVKGIGTLIAAAVLGVTIGHVKDYIYGEYEKRIGAPVKPFEKIKHVDPKKYDAC